MCVPILTTTNLDIITHLEYPRDIYVFFLFIRCTAQLLRTQLNLHTICVGIAKIRYWYSHDCNQRATATCTMFICRCIIDNFFLFEDSWFRFIVYYYYDRLLLYCEVCFRDRFSLLVLFILWPCCVLTRWPFIIIIIIVMKNSEY